jgi:hypothetical protein
MMAEKQTTGKRIPISSAKEIGKKFGYSQVIVVAHDGVTGIESVCTWGENSVQCEQAAIGGNFVKKALNWPPEKCNAKPSRQKEKEAYGKLKWEQAYNETWEAINTALGSLPPELSQKLCSVICPDFKP